MSYLLKALQQAEKERQSHAQGEQDAPQVVSVQSSLPKSLIVVVGLLVGATIWQMFPKSSLDQDELEEDSISEVHEPKQDVQYKSTTKPVEQIEVVASDPEISDAVKTLSDLNSKELSQIPSLELASHIYSSAPEFRSVVINGQSYKEGMLIKAGVVLDEIIQSGIIINVHGQKVELPKGISWIASQHVK